MARPGGLGRGLGSLIPSGTGGDPAQELIDPLAAVLVDVPIDAIVPNPHQPRVHFEESSLNDLADSIREIGVLQPVLLRVAGQGSYQLVAGERRWRAARKAGLTTIPAVIRTTDDMAAVEQALVENLHRQDLTALEEAAAYQQLIEDFGLTHDQVATRVGKSRSAVTNTLRLMQLPGPIQQLVADGRLSAGHARALLGCDDRAYQEQLARRVVNDGWSVRFVEEAIRDRTFGAPTTARDSAASGTSASPERGDRASMLPPTRDAALLELEDLLSSYLDTRVQVSMSSKRGKITVDFADLEDLERLFHRMKGAPREIGDTVNGEPSSEA